ncbi:MAG TPA: SDR family oxidoreductase [Amycolatopsis sp.]|nr:SDR family oxidoreductase [Amycolatopsis sp.]HVV08239.1 SDR family oxidoreductase [Amycolatopsis sp.]
MLVNNAGIQYREPHWRRASPTGEGRTAQPEARDDAEPRGRRGVQRVAHRPHPARRWGTLSDVVGPAVWLSSGASDYVNGQIVFVDGGMTVVG